MFRNIDACKKISNITRSSFGPCGQYTICLYVYVHNTYILTHVHTYTGMNKMVINHLEKLFVTNDAATVIKELEVYYT